eukprot:4716300-Prymnesium_polylepis.1
MPRMRQAARPWRLSKRLRGSICARPAPIALRATSVRRPRPCMPPPRTLYTVAMKCFAVFSSSSRVSASAPARCRSCSSAGSSNLTSGVSRKRRSTSRVSEASP